MASNFLEKENTQTQNVEQMVDRSGSNTSVASSAEVQLQQQPSLQHPEVGNVDAAAGCKIYPHVRLREINEFPVDDAARSPVDEVVTADATVTSSCNKTDDENIDNCTIEEKEGDNSEHGPLAMLRKGAVAAVGGTMVCIIQGAYRVL
jgi:hypothetical protein